MLAPKAGVQAGLGREVNCLKDQVDILRESSYSYNRHEQVLTKCPLSKTLTIETPERPLN